MCNHLLLYEEIDMIKIDQISKTYSSNSGDVHALVSISALFPNFGFVCITGKSGCGKSTFLHILGLMETFDDGEIEYNDTSYRGLTEKTRNLLLSNVFSFVFQENNLMEEFTVFDNLAISSDVNGETILNLLKQFDLSDKSDKYPSELSGGEKQRIAICRSLLKDSKVILVDEPTGNLDEENSLIVMNLLKDISKQKLVIMITHDIDYAKQYCDFHYEIKDGKLLTNKENPLPTFEEKEETLEYKKINLKCQHIFHFVRKIMKERIRKIIQYVFLFTVTFFVLGLGFSTLFTNEFTIASENMLNSMDPFYYIRNPNSVIIKESEYTLLSEILEDNIFRKYEIYPIYASANDILIYGENYTPKIDSVVYYNENVELIFGSPPASQNDVVVSDYFLTCLMKQQLSTNSDYSEFLGTKILNTNLNISGVYDTDFERFSDLLDSDTYYLYNENANDVVVGQLTYKFNAIYPIIYVSNNFDFSYTGQGIPSDVVNFYSFSPLTFSTRNLDDSTLSIYSDEITSDTQIIISQNMLFEYLKSDDSYSFSSYLEFYNYWLSHEEELIEYVKGRSVDIANTSADDSQGGQFDFIEYEIVGVTVDDFVTSRVYITTNQYNQMAVEKYAIMSYIDTNKDSLASQLTLIRDQGYYYDSWLSSRVIGFIEKDGTILRVFAFTISGVFLLYSWIMYSSLISKDIESKRKSVGILRSFGVSNSDVSKLFVFEVICISMISLLISLLLLPSGIAFLNLIVGEPDASLIIIGYHLQMVALLSFCVISFSIFSLVSPIKKLNSKSIVDLMKKDT